MTYLLSTHHFYMALGTSKDDFVGSEHYSILLSWCAFSVSRT